MVTIRFVDGTEIEAELNGTTLITDEKPEFPNDLSWVEIDGNKIQNAKIVEVDNVWDDKYMFLIIETPQIEITEQNTANIDYLSAMTGIDL